MRVLFLRRLLAQLLYCINISGGRVAFRGDERLWQSRRLEVVGALTFKLVRNHHVTAHLPMQLPGDWSTGILTMEKAQLGKAVCVSAQTAPVLRLACLCAWLGFENPRGSSRSVREMQHHIPRQFPKGCQEPFRQPQARTTSTHTGIGLSSTHRGGQVKTQESRFKNKPNVTFTESKIHRVNCK